MIEVADLLAAVTDPSWSAAGSLSETVIQEQVGQFLAGGSAPLFSPEATEDDQKRPYNMNLVAGIGREFGFGSPFGSRYIDLAQIGRVERRLGQPEWLCEIKVIAAKQRTDNGRFYPWFHRYEDYPESFNCMPGGSLLTNADEGQLFYDLAKMLCCLEVTKANARARLFQLLVVAAAGPNGQLLRKQDVISAVNRMIDAFNAHIGRFAIYDYRNKDRLIMDTSGAYELTPATVACEQRNGLYSLAVEWSFKAAASGRSGIGLLLLE